jgi:hypothetical protein
MAGLDPAIRGKRPKCLRDPPVKPGDDELGLPPAILKLL